MPATVHVAGPVFLDVVMGGLRHAPRPGEEQWVPECAILPGGAANQAVALSRLGVQTTLLSYLGEDDAGSLVADMLGRDGVDVSASVRVPRQSVTASLAFDGDRAMTTFGSDTVPSFGTLPGTPTHLIADLRAIRDNSDCVRRWRDPSTVDSADVPEKHGQRVHQGLTHSGGDVHGQPWVIADVGWDPTGKWDPDDLDALAHVDVFTPNEIEALHYTRSPDALSAARVLAEQVGTVIVTRGERGVIARTSSEEIELPALPAPVLDTTGAGDTFAAGYVWGYLHGLGLRGALTVGSLAAAYTVGRPGGSSSAPTLPELACWTRAQELPESYDPEFLDLVDDVGASPRE